MKKNCFCSGNGDGFYSSAFQSQLEGNSLYNASMPLGKFEIHSTCVCVCDVLCINFLFVYCKIDYLWQCFFTLL